METIDVKEVIHDAIKELGGGLYATLLIKFELVNRKEFIAKCERQFGGLTLGYFETETCTIVINLDAHHNDQNEMVRTIRHETYHFYEFLTGIESDDSEYNAEAFARRTP